MFKMKNATFIPPNVDDMHDALSKLELYIHKIDYQDPLIRTALIHYQFETIHLFWMGTVESVDDSFLYY